MVDLLMKRGKSGLQIYRAVGGGLRARCHYRPADRTINFG